MAITLEKRNPVNLILIVILVLVAGAAGYFYWTSLETTKQLNHVSVRLNFLEEEKAKVAAELQKSQTEIESYKQKIEELTKEAELAKKNQQSAEADTKKKIDEIAALQKRYEKRIQELENEVKQYADFNILLTKSLEPIQEAIVKSNPEQSSGVPAAGVQQAVPTPKVFSVESVTKPSANVELATGQVISIDREFGFVVVNFGSANGVKPGSIVEIYHRDKLLGMGNVERAQDKISAVSIVSEDLRSKIEKGDRAVLIS